MIIHVHLLILCYRYVMTIDRIPASTA